MSFSIFPKNKNTVILKNNQSDLPLQIKQK